VTPLAPGEARATLIEHLTRKQRDPEADHRKADGLLWAHLRDLGDDELADLLEARSHEWWYA
jgi:hypothetical protein